MNLSPAFEAALQFSATVHQGQFRKGTQVPYISHPLAVASIVLEYGGDEDAAVAALLHDSVEDCGVDPVEIRNRFGDKAANIVVACSDSLEKDSASKAGWRIRKEAHLEHMETVPSPALLVLAADKLHNVRSIVKDIREIGPRIWDRFKGGKDGTLWYQDAVLEILKKRGQHRVLVDELARSVAELQRLASSI